MDRHPDPKTASHGSLEILSALASLGPQQRVLAELRFVAELSLKEIAALLDLSPALVKSRLYEVRKKLRHKLEKVPETQRTQVPIDQNIEEKIMDTLHALRLGAHVFERLSLDVQAQCVLAVLMDDKLNEASLASIGKIDRGAEFVALYGTRFSLKELVGILNHVDRFTEARLMHHLDMIAPEQSEKIKQNLFVFEDMTILDDASLQLVVKETNPEVLAIALMGTDRATREFILSTLLPEQKLVLERNLAQADGGHHLIKSSQEFVVNVIKDLEAAGRLKVRRKSEVHG